MKRPVSLPRSVALGLAVLWLAASAPARAAARGDPDPAAVEFFEKKIRPVLVENCQGCHSLVKNKKRGGLTLDSRQALLKGGDNGPAVAPGEPGKSLLLKAIGYKDPDLRMPPKSKLPDAVIADLAKWVALGAPWSDEKTVAAADHGKFDLQKRRRGHWAWQPVRPPAQLPVVKNTAWACTAIDRFLLAGLEAKGLKPAPAADRRTLLRRVYFDLVGLPPPPAAVEAFVRDESPEALAKVVDRLLASPPFGERWARHWLDLVRYAESRGHEFDYAVPNAHQYRDYVIRALNADVPYDRFVTEHVAGDLLAKPRLHPTEGFNESILGTGFWFLGEELHSPVDPRQDEADRFDNRIDVLTKAFLGLTVSCARCHDHKFDAISTKDYYALFGFLESSSYRLARFDALEHNRGIARDLAALRDQARPAVQRALAEAVRPTAARLADYLLAAREALTADRGRLQGIAEARQLEAGLLARWVAHLVEAAADVGDPLHAWARPQLLRPTVESWSKRSAEASAAIENAEAIVDYTAGKPAAWLPDDVTFGIGPVRAGDLYLGGELTRPVLKFFEHGAAEFDPVWKGLRPAAGAENDPGALGRMMRAGRTLRTPGFTLTRGKLFYLVRGQGMAYAAVDQHVLINGPLHAQFVTGFNAGPGFRWVAHDLTPYKGHQAHVEFTPADGADFAIALVVQADQAPGALDRPNRALLRLLSGKDADSPEALAVGYQRLLLDTVARLAGDGLRGTPASADHARLANWLVRHTDLFATEKDRQRVTGTAAAFLAEQGKLTARIKTTSRLAPALLDGSGVDERVFIRGSPKSLGEVAKRRFLEALAGPEPLAVARGSGRLELARQMTDPVLNPFLARVMVNRLWHHLFGRGLVGSVDNFGELGERPTHPELLDHLADRFVKEGWSLKKMIRTMVLTSAYQMSSRPGGRGDQLDPEDLLLHRARVRRLEGEAIRDAMLAVSGRLDAKLYGPSVPVYLTPFLEGRGRPASGPLDGDGRRSLYLAVRRNFLSPLLLAFDTPIPFSTVGRRSVSNVPAQALILLNDPLVHQQAKLWAKRVLAQPGTARERIHGMYLSAISRPPTTAEVAACLEFLGEQARLSGRGQGDEAVWADLAHTLFNVKEFIFLH